MNTTITQQETTRLTASLLEFNLINASSLYFEKLNQIKKSYVNPPSSLNIGETDLNDALEIISKTYKLKGFFKSIITFEPSKNVEKENQIISILDASGIEVQGIRLSQDQTTIEIGFLNSSDKYKALLTLESIGL